MKNYYVYILTNQPRGTLYIGVTNNIQRRVLEHQHNLKDGFTKKYGLKNLVYVQHYECIQDALSHEKKLKFWRREWKIDLIEKQNPLWHDLFDLYFRESL
jgi:putative endonuclease